MNKLIGVITQIESSTEMSLVAVDVAGAMLYAIVLETPATAAYLKIGRPIEVIFKETEVAIAKNLSGLISMRNRFSARIERIDQESILSTLYLIFQTTPIVAIISTGSVHRLSLKVGDEIEWLVKTNEMSLCPLT